MTLRKLTRDEVTFELHIEPDDMPIRGNVMATDDDEQDCKDEQDVIDRVNAGETHAWCTLRVVASWEGFEGSDLIGGVSLQKEADAQGCADDNGLYVEALGQLNAKIAETARKLERLEPCKVCAAGARCDEHDTTPPRARLETLDEGISIHDAIGMIGMTDSVDSHD